MSGSVVRLELHEETTQKLNQEAEALLLTVQMKPQAQPVPAGFIPDVPVKAVLQEKDISNFQTRLVGADGKRLSRFFPHETKDVGFEAEEYKNFVRFCEGMQKQKPFHNYISLSFLEDVVFDWVRERYCGTTTQNLLDFSVPRYEATIEDVEVWIPISYTYTQINFAFANIIIKTFSQSMFDDMRRRYVSVDIPEENRAGFLRTLDHYQEKIGGLAAATMTVTAEPRRAYEIAQEQAEKMVALMRIFSGPIFVPELGSCTALYGQKTVQTNLYMVLSKERMFLTDGEDGIHDVPYQITSARFQMWNETGVGTFAELFFNTKRTKLEEKVYQSLMIYSRSTLMTNASDKLMYVFSALESLLVRDMNENLQQNVADRIAFTVSKVADERRKIVKNYKDAYSLRSRYVHHGHTIGETDVLKTFYYNVFRFFVNMVHFNLSHKTQDDFLSAIENLKYS